MEKIFWLLGTIGAVSFAINLLPEVIKAYREKKAPKLSSTFFGLAVTGNTCSAAFVFYTNWTTGLWQVPLYANYFTALTLTIILLVQKRIYNN